MRYFILFIALVILSGCGISESIIEPDEEPFYTLEKGAKSKIIVCLKQEMENLIKSKYRNLH
ncbi:hypothetical protein ACFLS9_01740 [Bacteroidota bacterium]